MIFVSLALFDYNNDGIITEMLKAGGDSFGVVGTFQQMYETGRYLATVREHA